MISPPWADGRLIARELPVLMVSVAAVPLVLLDGTIGTAEAAVMLAAAAAFTAWTLAVSSKETSATTEAILAEAPEVAGETRLRLVGYTVLGLALLAGGGNLFVHGARGVALSVGMSERVVGLTIGAIGTSLPELAASVVAALRGHSSLAIGNVVGSNIFNLLLVAGVTSIVRPIPIPAGGHMDLLLVALLSLMLFGVSATANRRIIRGEALLLLSVYVGYILWRASTAG
jgi:cation:H+ antiporter